MNAGTLGESLKAKLKDGLFSGAKMQKNIEFNRLRNNTLFSGCIHEDEYCDKAISKHIQYKTMEY